MAKKATGTAKRYGTRYGRRLREKVSAIEKEYKTKNKCPYCNKNQLTRVAAGIWHCKKCNKKFAGRAYTSVQTSSKAIEAGEE